MRVDWSFEESGVSLVQVASEGGVLLPEIPIGLPLLESLGDAILADSKHVLSVLTAGLLQAPGRRIVEAETTSSRARVLLLEVIARFNAWVSRSLCVE